MPTRYVWAGKLVRGAYMVSEREKAEEEGYESPVFEVRVNLWFVLLLLLFLSAPAQHLVICTAMVYTMGPFSCVIWFARYHGVMGAFFL